MGDYMRIILLRHGKTNINNSGKVQGIDDNSLDFNYIHEFNDTINHLKNRYQIDMFISSPLRRAFESLIIVKRALNSNLPIIINKNFIERDFGELTGEDVKLYYNMKNYPAIYEKDIEIQNRIINELKKLNKLYENKTILIGSHSHVCKSILIIAGIEKNYNHVFKNCGIVVLDYNGYNFKLIDELRR